MVGRPDLFAVETQADGCAARCIVVAVSWRALFLGGLPLATHVSLSVRRKFDRPEFFWVSRRSRGVAFGEACWLECSEDGQLELNLCSRLQGGVASVTVMTPHLILETCVRQGCGNTVSKDRTCPVNLCM